MPSDNPQRTVTSVTFVTPVATWQVHGKLMAGTWQVHGKFMAAQPRDCKHGCSAEHSHDTVEDSRM